MAQRTSTEGGAGGTRGVVIGSAVAALLERYRPPAGFEGARGKAFAASVVRALDRRLPSLPAGELVAAMERICEAVAAEHDSHDWPTLPRFLRAAGGVPVAPERREGAGYGAEVLAFYAEAVNGEGFLPQAMVGPPLARALIDAGLVTRARLRERGVQA